MIYNFEDLHFWNPLFNYFMLMIDMGRLMVYYEIDNLTTIL